MFCVSVVTTVFAPLDWTVTVPLDRLRIRKVVLSASVETTGSTIVCVVEPVTLCSYLLLTVSVVVPAAAVMASTPDRKLSAA